MTSSKKKLPPVHPGEALQEIMNEAGLSANALALALRVPGNRITAILNRQRGITADTALRLGRYFGTSAQMWMNLQSTYELEAARRHTVRPDPAGSHAATCCLDRVRPQWRTKEPAISRRQVGTESVTRSASLADPKDECCSSRIPRTQLSTYPGASIAHLVIERAGASSESWDSKSIRSVSMSL